MLKSSTASQAPCTHRPPSAPPCSVDRLPLIHTVFELLGLCVSMWFTYRWFFVAGEKEAITSTLSKITKDIGLDL